MPYAGSNPARRIKLTEIDSWYLVASEVRNHGTEFELERTMPLERTGSTRSDELWQVPTGSNARAASRLRWQLCRSLSRPSAYWLLLKRHIEPGPTPRESNVCAPRHLP